MSLESWTEQDQQGRYVPGMENLLSSPPLTQEYNNQAPWALPLDHFNLFDLTLSHIQTAKANCGKLQRNQGSPLMTFYVPFASSSGWIHYLESRTFSLRPLP